MAKLVFNAGVFKDSPLFAASTATQITVLDRADDTLASLWSDRDGLVVKSNPFFISSAGKIEFYADPGRYRVTAQNGGFTQIWEDVLLIDPDAGGGGGTVDSVVAGDGGIAVDSTDPANPIVSNTALGDDKYRTNVLNYGATGDGTTDDTVAFEAARAACALTSHKRLFFPPGEFVIDKLTINTDGMEVFGAGRSATTLILRAQTITDIEEYKGILNIHGVDVSNKVSGVVVRDMTLDGNKSNVTIAGTTNPLNIECVDLQFASNCYLYRLTVKNSWGDGIDYDYCEDCEDVDTIARDCNGNGIHKSMQCINITSVTGISYACGGFHSRSGFDIYGGESGDATGCKYVSCKAYECYKGFSVDGSGSELTGCDAINSTNTGIRIEGDGNQVSGGRVTGSAVNNITIGGDENTITGAVSTGAGGGSGLRILDAASHNVITGGQFSDNSDRGINITGNNNLVNGASCRRNSGGATRDLGAGNIIDNII